MAQLRRIQEFEHIKMLTDTRRLAILRLLMAHPATLSQLGQALGEHPARVRHHVKLLEDAGLIEMTDTRVVRGFVEKYYQARAQAFYFHEMILPDGPQGSPLVVLGSHDLALEMLADQVHQAPGAVDCLALPVGSLEGLIALRQGIAQVAGCHLLDADSGEYNLPFVRHLFPDKPVTLVTLAYRQQGLLVAPGNPLGIQGLQDLARPDVTMINRNPGSGTRLWLDRQLQQMGLSGPALRGYKREARTHTAVAEAIHRARADVGLGLEASAHALELDFIPLFAERFDLAFPSEQIESRRLQPLLDILQSAAFRQTIERLEGYESAHTGERLIP